MTRSVAEGDSRGRRIALTEAGRRLTDDLMEAHLANQRELLKSSSDDERAALARLLAKLGKDLN